MKSVAILAFAAGVSAQVASFNAVGSAIDARVKALNSAVLAYTGGNGAAAVSDAGAVLSAINSGASVIPSFSSFTDLGDALSLLPVYQAALASDVVTVVGNLVSKRSIVNANGLCPTVSSLLVAESSAALKLAAAVVAQLQDPNVGGATDIASGSVINPITSALASGIAAYTSCPAATSTSSGSGSSSSSSSSSEPTSGSSSSSSSASGSSSSSGTTSSSGSTTTGSTCTTGGYNTKQIKKCLKIISSAALAGGAGATGYGEL